MKTIKNPYLDKFIDGGGDKWLSATEMDYKLIHGVLFLNRIDLCVEYSWAVPDKRSLDIITKYSPVVEVGAGTGYWASLLSKNGCDITTYDIAPVSSGIENQWHTSEPKFEIYEDKVIEKPTNEYFSVIMCDEDFTPDKDKTLMLCWPPYDTPMAVDYLRRYKGNHVIYIGEFDGCNANDDFFGELSTCWQAIDTHDVPQWYGIHDVLEVYERK